MELNRRRFLQYTSAGLLAPTASIASFGDQVGIFMGTLAILQGATDETSTQITVLHSRGRAYDFVATTRKDIIRPTQVQNFTFEDDEWSVSKIHFTGLDVDLQYEFHVLAGGKTIDRREFRSLALNRTKAKIAVCSCMQDFLHHRGIWDELWQSEPDVIFFAGDTVYADFDGGRLGAADPHRLWTRHVATRNRLMGFRQQKLIPLLAVWDDHDFGHNGSNRDFPHKQKAKEIFETFFAQDAGLCSALKEGPGVSRQFSAFGQEFYFMDGRSYRSADVQDDEAVFGKELSQWLYRGLALTQKPSWIVSGSQFFGKYRGKDSFEHIFGGQFRAFTEHLRSLKGAYGFISGDVHFSEVMRLEREFLGYESVEITSSSMHSFTLPGQHLRFRNPRRMAATSYHNFVIFEVQAGQEDLRLAIASRKSGREVFRTDFHLRA